LYEDRPEKKTFRVHILYFFERGLWLLEGKESACSNLVGKPEENTPLRRPGYIYIYIYKNNIKTDVKFDEQVCIGPTWSNRGLYGWLF
jgi:hypothetical protein